MIIKTKMYSSHLPRIIFCNNLNSVSQSRSYFTFQSRWLFGDKFHAGIVKFYSFFTKNVSAPRTITFPNVYHELYGSKLSLNRITLLRCVKRGFQKFPQSLKEQSVQIVKVCTQQCECVLAHRIRRGQQIFSLYSKLWDEVALKELMRKMRQQLSKRGKEFIFSTVGISAYNWDKERIPDEELQRQLNEMKHVYELRDFTITCPECRKRMVIDTPLPNTEYCSCSPDKNHCLNKSLQGWQPFLEREDLLVWRKECEQCQGMYIYKVYGRYSEITAEDFLQVQIDTEFRMVWDNTAINLQVIEQDASSNSDIVYWEMEWPRLFSNRDYVFNRRYLIDRTNRTIVIINKGTEHPNVPVKTENHRVTDYWSIMVIKAYNSLEKPGLEFSLTYFDNPGVSIPSSITAWVAMSGLPDFQVRLRQAARDYKSFDGKRRFGDSYQGGTKPTFHSKPTSDSSDDEGSKHSSDKDPEPSAHEPEPSTQESSPDQPLPTQEHHIVSPSSSKMYLKQFHAWQLFI